MKNTEHINNEVNKTLSSLDGIDKAEANPYLYAKITERLQAGYEVIPPKIKWLSLGLVASLVITVMVILNTSTKQSQTAEEAFAEQYSLSVNSYSF